MQDCSDELRSLLLEDVHQHAFVSYLAKLTDVVWLLLQRLAGASLLVFANKQDIRGSMSDMEIREVRDTFSFFTLSCTYALAIGPRFTLYQVAPLEDYFM